MPPRRPTAAAADTDQTAEELPTFDGSQVQLSQWFRELLRYQHLLPAELAYYLVTGAANAAQGKTAVVSVQHAHLLFHDLVEPEGFHVCNPPPMANKFVDLYATSLANDPNSPLPANPGWSQAIKDQYQLAPSRLFQLEIQYRNMLLGLIASPGRKAHYATIA